MEKALAQQIAERVSVIFPELNGRSIAVSEIEPFKDKREVPPLPIAVVALAPGGTGEQNKHGGGRVRMTDNFVIEFIVKSERYKDERRVLPFYSFYNYEKVRTRLLSGLRSWTSENNIGVSYKSIGVESDQFAVYITITVSMTFDWCDPEPQAPVMVLGAGSITIRSAAHEPQNNNCPRCERADCTGICTRSNDS